MPSTDIIPVAGLYTDPNPNVVPAGALVRAENVVVRRPHVLEPRPGFGVLTAHPATSADRVRSLFAYDGKLYASVRASGGTWTLYSWNGTAWTTMTGVSATPPDPDRIEMRTAPARKNLYYTSADGIAKIVGASDSSPEEASLPRASQGNATLAGGATWFPDNEFVAYRIVYLRRDANGLDVRSAPSGRFVIENTAGSPATVVLRIPLPGSMGILAGDVVEVYRSESSTGDTPSDEMQLALTLTLTSGNISAGYVDVTDAVTEDHRGAALYTSPSQEGILQENAPMPIAREVAVYAGMLFVANVVRPASIVLELTDKDPAAARSFGLKEITGDFNSTSTVTNVSAADIALLVAGMYVTDNGGTDFKSAGTYIPAETKVVTLGATSFTMDKTALGTGANITFNATDVLTVEGTEFIGGNVEDLVGQPAQYVWASGERSGAQNLAHALNRSSLSEVAVVLSETAGHFKVALYGKTTSAGIALASTHGEAWSPPIHQTLTSRFVETELAGIAWSKQDEPEHMPPVNFALVGNPLKRILRLVPTRDSLWIFKEDGVWRLTGTGPDDLRIDPFDADLLLLIPEAVAVLRDRVYAWTNRGVVALGDAGAVDVGRPIYDTIESITKRLVVYPSAPKGAFAVALSTTDEFVLFVPTTVADNVSTRAYVFNASTTCWTTWEFSCSACAHNPADDLLYLGGFGSSQEASVSNQVHKERRNYGTTWDGYDAAVSVTVNSTTATTITLSASQTYTAGDGINTQAGGQVAIATASGTGSVIPVDSTSGIQPGAGSLLRAYASTVEWAPQAAQDIALTKHWQEGVFFFEDLAGVYSMVHGFASEIVGTFQTFSQTFTRVITAAPREARCGIPREASASVRLRPRIAITQAASRWALSGLKLLWEPIGDRVRR